MPLVDLHFLGVNQSLLLGSNSAFSMIIHQEQSSTIKNALENIWRSPFSMAFSIKIHQERLIAHVYMLLIYSVLNVLNNSNILPLKRYTDRELYKQGLLYLRAAPLPSAGHRIPRDSQLSRTSRTENAHAKNPHTSIGKSNPSFGSSCDKI